MFYTHSDKPRILAAPLNCLQDIIHVWAVSIRQWGSIAFNAKYIRIIHLSFIQQKNVVQLLSHGRLFVTPWTAACQASLSITNFWSLLRLMWIKSVMPSTISSSVIPFSSCLQSFPASGSFQWVSSLHQVAKVLEFQLQHQSFQWIFRTDFFRMD